MLKRIMGDHNPPATLLIVPEFPRSGVEVEIEAIAANALVMQQPLSEPQVGSA